MNKSDVLVDNLTHRCLRNNWISRNLIFLTTIQSQMNMLPHWMQMQEKPRSTKCSPIYLGKRLSAWEGYMSQIISCLATKCQSGLLTPKYPIFRFTICTDKRNDVQSMLIAVFYFMYSCVNSGEINSVCPTVLFWFSHYEIRWILFYFSLYREAQAFTPKNIKILILSV